MALFNKHFDAHDALEDVKALRRILFESRFNFTRDLLNYCQPIPFNEAYDDSPYLCKRHELTETFGSLLYDNSDEKSTISKCMQEKIAGSGLSYANLKRIIDKFGRKRTCSSVIYIASWFQKPKGNKNEEDFACNRPPFRTVA